MTAKKTSKPKGRPTRYKAEYCELATNYCLMGATDEDLAGFFDVTVTTIDTWKKKHREFLGAIKEGKEVADGKVAKSLYERATGYTHSEEKLFHYQGEVIRAQTTKHYPPETTAAIFWLKNRQRDLWRDKHEIEATGDSLVDALVQLGNRLPG